MIFPMTMNRPLKILFTALAGVLVIFLLWPILRTVLGSSPGVLFQTLVDPEVLNVILFTFYSSLLATGVAFVLGIPLAYMLARYTFPGKRVVEGIIDVPIVIPHSAAGIALLMVFSRGSILGQAFSSLGIKFISSAPGVVVAMMFVSVPFLIDSAREGFEAVDPRLEHVARTLGASSWEAFWRVSFPLAWRGILSGMIMMWARGISEFGAVVILAYHPMIAPVLLYERFLSFGLEYAVPVAALIILISLLIFIFLRGISAWGDGDA